MQNPVTLEKSCKTSNREAMPEGQRCSAGRRAVLAQNSARGFCNARGAHAFNVISDNTGNMSKNLT